MVARIVVPRDQPLLQAAHDFHSKRVGEFLLPRNIDEFDKFARDGELWVAIVDSTVVAACYVSREDDAVGEAEFGGIIVHEQHEGKTGLGTAIGTVALARHALHDPKPVIAHVHVDNNRPIALLTKRLGFSKRAGGPKPYKKAEFEAKLNRSISMKADKDGLIWGDTYDFSQTYLKELADRLEAGALAKIKVQVESPYFDPENLKEAVARLRELAAGKP